MAKHEVSDGKTYIYGAREISTGKMVSNITNPRRKYWDREGNALNAIRSHNTYDAKHGRPGIVELVKFELVEVTDKTVE